MNLGHHTMHHQHHLRHAHAMARLCAVLRTQWLDYEPCVQSQQQPCRHMTRKSMMSTRKPSMVPYYHQSYYSCVDLVIRNTLTVIDNRTGKSYEIPIENDTIKAIDLRGIRVDAQDFGTMYVKGIFGNRL